MNENKIGETNISNDGLKMEIITYIDRHNIIVKFDNGYTKNTRYTNFKRGSIKNPYYKSIYNFGYLGEGKYRTRVNNKITPQYNIWSALITRCYDPYKMNKCLSYIDCEVCPEWANYQTFGQFYDENIYHIPNEKMQIEKDILCRYLNLDNKIYSPDTCLFVPQTINNLFTTRKQYRSGELIGVYYDSREYKNSINKYNVSLSKAHKKIHLGSYPTEIQAFNVYKREKEKYVKEMADLYKKYIPEILYKALYAFEVKITD